MTAAPELLHLFFTLVGLALGWYLKHQSLRVPPDVLALVERLLAARENQQAHGYLKDLLEGAAPPPPAPPKA